MDSIKFERMFDPKISNSLPREVGHCLRCAYEYQKYFGRDYITGVAMYSDPIFIDGIIFLGESQGDTA